MKNMKNVDKWSYIFIIQYIRVKWDIINIVLISFLWDNNIKGIFYFKKGGYL